MHDTRHRPRQRSWQLILHLRCSKQFDSSARSRVIFVDIRLSQASMIWPRDLARLPEPGSVETAEQVIVLKAERWVEPHDFTKPRPRLPWRSKPFGSQALRIVAG